MLLLLTSGLLATAASVRAVPLEAYGRLPVEHLVLAPDGRSVAYASDVDGTRAVLVRSLDGGELLGRLDAGDEKLRGLTWVGSRTLLVTTSVTDRALGVAGPRSEYAMIQTYDLTTGKQKALLNDVDDAMNVVLSVPTVRKVGDREIVFLTGISFRDREGVPTLFSVDLRGRRTKLLHVGSRDTLEWWIDRGGAAFATTEFDDDDRRWRLRLRERRGWRTALEVPATIERPVVLGLGPAGDTLVVSIGEDGAGAAHRQLVLADGSWGPTLDLGTNPYETIEDPVTHRVIGARQLTTATTHVFLDPADQEAWDRVARAFPGENVELVSWSDDRRRLAVRVDGKRNGAGYFLVDQDARRARPIVRVHDGIAPADVAEVRAFSYAASDGLQIPAYLTLPNGRAPTALPLVVLAHGGPAARDGPQFDWWAQSLASRGYAVLQPQFRGSSGFGWEHLAAGFGEWGRKMQSDLSDGVRFLAADGTVDPGRVCIAGASYGGYAALAGATIDAGVYRCAVSVAGVSDPARLLHWLERSGRRSASLRYWSRFLGVSGRKDPALRSISPLARAQEASAPILLVHGKDDTVVPIEQSQKMKRALEKAGKPVTFLELDGEDHWLSRSDTRIQLLTAAVAFLEQHNPPGE